MLVNDFDKYRQKNFTRFFETVIHVQFYVFTSEI